MSKSCLILKLEEERRKHDLLVEITRKERDHNRRLVSNGPSTSLVLSLLWVADHVAQLVQILKDEIPVNK